MRNLYEDDEDDDEEEDDVDDEVEAKVELGIEEDDDQGQAGASDWPPSKEVEDGTHQRALRAKKPSLDLIRGENSKRLIQLFEKRAN